MKNRISAKKCRDKKKEQMQSLEKELASTKEELEKYKNHYHLTKDIISSKTQMLENKEKELIHISKLEGRVSCSNILKERIKNEHKIVQYDCIIELFRQIVIAITPIDIKLFTHKLLRLNDLTDFKSFDALLEKITQNQKMLNEIYNFKLFGSEKVISFPIKIYAFFEHLKNFTRHFREFFFRS